MESVKAEFITHGTSRMSHSRSTACEPPSSVSTVQGRQLKFLTANHGQTSESATFIWHPYVSRYTDRGAVAE